MSDLKVAVSTFPYLYSHSGFAALKHFRSLGHTNFGMMIFPPTVGQLTWRQSRSVSLAAKTLSKIGHASMTVSESTAHVINLKNTPDADMHALHTALAKII
jgi:spore maturation protein SpmB